TLWVPRPTCEAVNRDGARCRSMAVADGLCQHHLAQAAEHGPERARSGSVGKRRALTVEATSESAETPAADTTALALVETNGSAAPGSIRPALAKLAAENLPELQKTLLDAALSATTERWATVCCSGCGTRSRVELPVPDVKARLQAIQLLLT